MHRLAMLAVLALAGCARPPVAVLGAVEAERKGTGIEVRYYEVTGDSVQALRDALEREGPVFDDGETYDAITRWKWTWRAWWDDFGGECVVTGLDVGFHATVDFPLWVPPPDVDPAVVERWRTFTDALWTHEMNHARNGMRSAEQVRRELRRVTAPTCDEMHAALDADGKRIVAEANDWDTWYDEDSDRGWNEGVRFP